MRLISAQDKLQRLTDETYQNLEGIVDTDDNLVFSVTRHEQMNLNMLQRSRENVCYSALEPPK